MGQSSIAPGATEESTARAATAGSGFGHDDQHRFDLTNSLPGRRRRRWRSRSRTTLGGASRWTVAPSRSRPTRGS